MNNKMENENSVAFIAKISKLNSIDGADKIEVAQLNGWNSIVQKNIHKEGDLVLCITTDAVISQDLCDKWGITSYLRKGNRVRTVKLKGVYSECILIPLVDIPNISQYHVKGIGYELLDVGKDMMEELNISKYEPPIREISIPGDKTRKVRYQDNPNFHIYYKFPNHKNVPNMFNEDDEVVITRKIHGTNARYGIVKKTKLSLLDRVKKFCGNKYIEYEYVYGSHNREKGSDSQGFYSTDVWKEIADKYDIKNKLWFFVKNNPEFKEGIIIYGEVFGEGIQGEKYNYGLKDKQIKLFDIKLNLEYVNHYEFCTLNHAYLGSLPMVEELFIGKWFKQIQEKYLYDNILNTNIPEEGIVIKCTSGNRQKVSKCINPNYLIFSEKHLIPDSH